MALILPKLYFKYNFKGDMIRKLSVSAPYSLIG